MSEYAIRGPYEADEKKIQKLIDSSPAAEHLRRLEKAMMALNYLRMIRLAFATNPAGIVIMVLIEVVMALVNFFMARRNAQRERERLAREAYKRARRREAKLMTYEGTVTIKSEDYNEAYRQLVYWSKDRYNRGWRRVSNRQFDTNVTRLENAYKNYEIADNNLRAAENDLLEYLRINRPADFFYRTEQITNLEYIWMVEHNVTSINVMRETFRNSRVYIREYFHGIFGEPEYLFFDRARGKFWEIREYLFNNGYIVLRELGFMRVNEIHTMEDLRTTQAINLYLDGYITWDDVLYVKKTFINPYELIGLVPDNTEIDSRDESELNVNDRRLRWLRAWTTIFNLGLVAKDRYESGIKIFNKQISSNARFLGRMFVAHISPRKGISDAENIPSNITSARGQARADRYLKWLPEIYFEYNLITSNERDVMLKNGFYSIEQLGKKLRDSERAKAVPGLRQRTVTTLFQIGLISKERYNFMNKITNNWTNRPDMNFLTFLKGVLGVPISNGEVIKSDDGVIRDEMIGPPMVIIGEEQTQPEQHLQNIDNLLWWMLEGYKNNNMISERAQTHMWHNGYYSVEQLNEFITKPPFTPIKEGEFDSKLRKLLLQSGVITKEDYAFMKKNGIYTIAQLKSLRERMAQEEYARKRKLEQQIKDERESKRALLFRTGKIDKSELEIMRQLDATTIKELREWQEMSADLPGIEFNMFDQIKYIEDIYKKSAKNKKDIAEIDKKTKEIYEIADKTEQIEISVIPEIPAEILQKPLVRKKKREYVSEPPKRAYVPKPPKPSYVPEQQIQELSIPEI